MGFFAFILLGLAAGAIAKAILPDRVKAGWFTTLIVGVVGALVGGWLGSIIFHTSLNSFFSLSTWVLAVGGSVIVLAVYGALAGRN